MFSSQSAGFVHALERRSCCVMIAGCGRGDICRSGGESRSVGMASVRLLNDHPADASRGH
jgi:hypothetical protein